MMATGLRVLLSLGLMCALSSWSAAAEDMSAFTKKLFAAYDQLRAAGQTEAADKLLKDAASHLQQQLDSKPDNRDARWALLMVQTSLKDFPAALGNADILIDQHPDNGMYHQSKGNIYLLARQFDDAERSYRRAMKLAPPRATAILIEFGNLLSLAGRSEQALAIAREAKKLEPDGDAPVLLFAAIAYHSENFGDWEKGLRAALPARPERKELRLALIKGLLELQKLDKAYGEFSVFDQTEPENGNCLLWLIRLAPHLTFPLNPQAHVDRLYALHRSGKYPDRSFHREDFRAAEKEGSSWEYFAAEDTKFRFSLSRERLEVSVGRQRAPAQCLRLAEELSLLDPTYIITVERNFKQERLQELEKLPSYQEARALALEIFQGPSEQKGSPPR